MKIVNPRGENIESYINLVERNIRELKNIGYTVEQATEIIKVAHMIHDGDSLDENLYGIGTSLESVSSSIEAVSERLEYATIGIADSISNLSQTMYEVGK